MYSKDPNITELNTLSNPLYISNENDPNFNKSLFQNCNSLSIIQHKNESIYHHTDISSPSFWDEKNISIIMEDDLPINKLNFKENLNGLITIASAAFPICSSLTLNMLVNFIILYFITLENNKISTDGIGMGLVYSNCTVIVFIYSLNQGLNALIAAAAGSNDKHLVGIYYQRGIILLGIFIIPLLSLQFYSSSILQILGTEPAIAEATQEYTKNIAASCIATALFDATKAYLVGQHIFYPVLFSQTIATILHVVWCYLFISKNILGLESSSLNYDGASLQGAAWARTCTEWTNCLLIWLYVKFSSSIKDSWIPWSRDAIDWNGILAFLKVAIPIGAVLFFDWLCYEIFSVIAANFGAEQLMVHVGIANTSTLFYNIPLGLSVSIMTFVSNALGGKKKIKAKNYIIYTLFILLVFLVVAVPTLLMIKNQWAYLFADDPNTHADFIKVFYVYIVGILIIDSCQVIISGVLKGIGKQKLATISLLIVYYLISIPLVIYLSFSLKQQVFGIWVGFSISVTCLLVFYCIILFTADWDEQLMIIRRRLKEEQARAKNYLTQSPLIQS